MARPVVWTHPAWDDLESAADYIARDSFAYAAVWVQEIKDAAASLSEHAERGQHVPEVPDDSIRELLVAPYRVVYKIAPDRISILAVVHGARRRWRQ